MKKRNVLKACPVCGRPVGFVQFFRRDPHLICDGCGKTLVIKQRVLAVILALILPAFISIGDMGVAELTLLSIGMFVAILVIYYGLIKVDIVD